jgi:hypothetical protein
LSIHEGLVKRITQIGQLPSRCLSNKLKNCKKKRHFLLFRQLAYSKITLDGQIITSKKFFLDTYYKFQFICNKWEKLAHSERAERFFGTSKKGPKGFLEHKRTFLNKKNTIKVQQKRLKTEERSAFENLSVHFGCAENLPSFPKRTKCCK